MKTKIIEIMPDNLPDWVYQDIKDGQLLSRLAARLEAKDKLIESKKKHLERNEGYFSVICEALEIDHKSDLTAILIAIESLSPRVGV